MPLPATRLNELLFNDKLSDIDKISDSGFEIKITLVVFIV